MSPVASTRWCPTPEQVMILEEMYRGGVRTPNAAQIQQITAHLSLYGKIEGKNVFYWFQNHKARDRQKLRKRLLIGKQLQQLQQHQQQQQQQDMVRFNQHVVVPPLPKTEHFQPPPFLQQLHFDQQPPTPRYAYTHPPSSHLAFHHPPAYASHQARTEDATPAGMCHRYAWKYGREKASRQVMAKTNDNDWTMSMFGDHDHEHHLLHHHHHVHDIHHHDDHHDVGSTTTTTSRPLKTLQLFPINDKISLKDHQYSSLEASNF